MFDFYKDTHVVLVVNSPWSIVGTNEFMDKCNIPNYQQVLKIADTIRCMDDNGHYYSLFFYGFDHWFNAKNGEFIPFILYSELRKYQHKVSIPEIKPSKFISNEDLVYAHIERLKSS